MLVKYLVRVALWIALVLALVGSLAHVAWGFSTLHGGDMTMGYVQAVAVDLGVAALTLGIQQRRRVGRPTLRLWGGVAMFALISTYANLLHGFAHAEESMLSGVPLWLRMLRPWLLSAALPLMVVYLSEIVSEDEGVESRQVDDQKLPESAAQGVAASSDPLSVNGNGHRVVSVP